LDFFRYAGEVREGRIVLLYLVKNKKKKRDGMKIIFSIGKDRNSKR